MFDVITIGSATVDVFAYTESSEVIKFVESKTEHDFIAYPGGEKIVIDKLDFKIGGGGTNTAVSFSRLGLNTAYLGKLGNDENGKKVLDLLNDENIKFIGSTFGQTGYSIVLDSFAHDRTILTYKGANNELSQSDVVLSSLHTKWLYASSMMGTSFETLKTVISFIKKTGAKVAFNPSSYLAKKGITELKEILDNVDVLVLNKEEAQYLLNDSSEDWIYLVKKLSELGFEYSIITDGPEGAICSFEGIIRKITTSPNLKVVESTGAGDAFASGFVAGLFYSLFVDDALKLGMIQAESVIVMPGAKDNLSHKKEAFDNLKNFKGEIEIVEGDLGTNSFIAPIGQEFILKNDIKIKGIEHLANVLKNISDDIYDFHTSRENHFYSWIKDVFGETDLAEKIKNSNSKHEMVEKIHKFLITKNSI